MFCKNCGKEISDDALFCKSCGEKTILFPNDVKQLSSKKNNKRSKKITIINLILFFFELQTIFSNADVKVFYRKLFIETPELYEHPDYVMLSLLFHFLFVIPAIFFSGVVIYVYFKRSKDFLVKYMIPYLVASGLVFVLGLANSTGVVLENLVYLILPVAVVFMLQKTRERKIKNNQ